LEIGYQRTVFLRAGYQWLSQTLPTQDQAGLSGGAGIALGDVNIDYAMTSYGNLGLTNQVSIAYQFAEPKAVPAKRETDADARVFTGDRGDGESGPNPAPTPVPYIKITVSPPPPPGAAGVTDDGTPLTMKAAYHTGIAAYKARDYEKAARYLKKSLALPSGPAESVFRAEANSMLGIIYQFFLKSPGSLDLARQYYQAALKIDPSNSTAQKHLPQVETAQ
jgi:tetratricopeptide (TPR) repeat protein